jgi:hypothetical protein
MADYVLGDGPEFEPITLEELENILSEKIKKNKKSELNKKYNINFKKKHEEEIKKRVICPLCFGSYTYFNKSGHSKTIRHMRAIEAKKD